MDENYKVQAIPEFYSSALKDESSLMEIIKSPEFLLENIFSGINNKYSKRKEN